MADEKNEREYKLDNRSFTEFESISAVIILVYEMAKLKFQDFKKHDGHLNHKTTS